MAKSSKYSKPNRRCDSTEPDQARVIPVNHSAVFLCPDGDIGRETRTRSPDLLNTPCYTARLFRIRPLHCTLLPAAGLLLLSNCFNANSVVLVSTTHLRVRCPDLWRRGLASLLPLPPPPASDRLHPLCLLHTALFIELGPPRFVWLGLGLGGVRISLHSTRWRPRFIWLGLGLGLGLASLRDARPLIVRTILSCHHPTAAPALHATSSKRCNLLRGCDSVVAARFAACAAPPAA